MKLLMCRSCGTFVRAAPESDAPIRDACPDCGGTDFADSAERDVQTL